MNFKHNGISSTKKKFKLFRQYTIVQNREGKVCVFKGFVIDCDQKMAGQVQKEELIDRGEHESLAWAAVALSQCTCKRRPVADPADRPHGGLEFHNKFYVRYLKKRELRLWELAEFAENVT